MAKWTANMLKKSKTDSEGFCRELCKGYLMLGEEVKVQGGITLDFTAKNVFYYVLKAVDHFCYQMDTYRDKKHSKKRDEQPLSTVRYTGQVLVHHFVIGQKKNHKEVIFVVIHAQRPIYYKPHPKQYDMWYRELVKVAQYSKEKEKQRAKRATPPINAPERYTPTGDDRFLGEYVSMRALQGPKKSHEVTKPKPTPKSTDRLSPGQTPIQPSKSDTALNAMAKRSEGIPRAKQNASKALLSPHRVIQNQERQGQQGIHNQTGHTRTRANSSSLMPSLRDQISPSQPRSQDHDWSDDEVSLPSIYAPQEITFDEIEEGHWGDDDNDDDDDQVGSRPPTRVAPKTPQTRKPVKRGRSFRRVREDGKFVWDMTHATSEEVNSVTGSQSQAKSSHHHLKDCGTTGSSPLSQKPGHYGGTADHLASKIRELKTRPLPVPKEERPQSHVVMVSSTQQRVSSSSTLRQPVDRLYGRRRSISDPADPSSFLQVLEEASGSSDKWSLGEHTVASPMFCRRREDHESVRSSESEGVLPPIYVLPSERENFRDGRHYKYNSLDGYGRARQGLTQTDVRSMNPPKDPLPVPITVIQSSNLKRHSGIPTVVYDEVYHTYDEITAVQNSRQVQEALTQQQKDGPICVELKKHEANDGLVFAEFKSKIWLASWKKDVNGRAKFQQVLHIGDQLMCVNGEDVRGVKHAAELISSSAGDMVKLLIQRIPFAEVLFLMKSMTDTWGCEFSKNELIKMYSGPLKESDIAETPYGLGKETTWVVTECQHQPVPIMTCDKDEVKNHLLMSKTELPLVLHPKNFIDGLVAKIKKNQKIMKHMSEYQL